MSLATRCTSCGTIFRVVRDQLKVSDGWVRCGRCDAVFNAAEGLFDLDHEAPPAWSPTLPPGEAPRSSPAALRPTEDERDEPRDDVAIDDHPAVVGVAAPAPRPPAKDPIATALARHAAEAASPGFPPSETSDAAGA